MRWSWRGQGRHRRCRRPGRESREKRLDSGDGAVPILVASLQSDSPAHTTLPLSLPPHLLQASLIPSGPGLTAYLGIWLGICILS